MLPLLVGDVAEETVVRVRSAENADAEGEAGVPDSRHETNPPMVWGPPPVVSKPLLISHDQVDGWWALMFTHAAVTARIDAVLMERHRISLSTCEILCRLQDSEPQAVRALASQLVSVSPTRASRLMQEHIDIGHRQRGADQGDGRVSLISLTETGRGYAETVKRTLEESIKKFFVDLLDDEDIAALTRIWAKLESASD